MHPFTIAEVETGPSDLVLIARSSNPTLVPDANILLGGSGTNRTISLRPTTNEIGRAVITIEILNASSGAQASENFGLTVLGAPPTIIEQPLSQVAAVGSTVTLSVEAEGIGPISYQWRKNGATLPGATGASLTLENIQPRDAGTYSVAVGNDYGTINSEPAIVELSVGSLPMTNNFADRGNLNGLAGLGSSSNAGATKEAGEQNHAGKGGGKSMWISWTAPSSGIASFSTEGSSFDTLLAVYTGDSLAGLTEVAKDDDSAGFYGSALRFNAFVGTVYNIAVDGLAGAEGRIILSWNLIVTAQVFPRILAQPQNQTVEFGTNVQFSVLTQGQALNYQWYFNGAQLAGANESILTRNNVQLADVGSYFVRVSNEDRFVDSDVVNLEINSIDGVTVKSVVSADKLADVPNGLGGAVALQDLTRRRIIRKSSSSSVARGFTGTQLFSTVGSAKEQDEPNHCGIAGGASQWFAYQPPKSGTVSINTDGSTFDTVLAVYTGTAADFASLQSVACDNNSGLDRRDSAVTFAAVAETVYYIAVDGVGGATGSVRLNYQLTFPIEMKSTALQSGLVGFGLICAPGQQFTIQSSTDLLTWVSMLTTNTPNGVFQFSDVEAPNFQRRFYRVQSAD